MGAPPPPMPAAQCPKCGTAVARGSQFCAACGAPVPYSSLATANPTWPTASAPTFARLEPPREKASIWIPIKLGIIPILAAFTTAFVERNAPAEEAFGYWLGAMLMPGLIALVVVGFKPAKRMRTFSTVFLCIGLLAIVANLAARGSRISSRTKTTQDVLREAAGTKPVDDTGSPSEQKVNRLIRQALAEVLEARKKHDAAFAPLQPMLATTYTAESFATRQHIKAMISTIQKVLQVDGALAETMENWLQSTQARVNTSDLDPSDKKDFLNGFQKSYGNSETMAVFREVHQKEEAWGAATIDLYTFALDHAADIKIAKKQIVIADKDVLDRFNAKFKTSRELRGTLEQANQRLIAAQTAGLQKIGLTKSDLGLAK